MKKILFTLISALLLASPLAAQAPPPASSQGKALVTHPEGAYTWGSKTILASPADWQCLGGQTHRKVANGIRDNNPLDLGHDHDILCGPIGAELDGSVNITVAVPLKMFQLDGDIIGVTASVSPTCFERVHEIPVSMSQLPVVGNPTAGAVVDSLAWYTFNVKDFVDVCVPQHGWFGITTKVSVKMHAGTYNVHTTEVTVPYFSMLDPTAPEPPLPEGGIQTSIRTTNASFEGDPQNVYGIQYIEIQHPFWLYGALKQPTRIDPLAAAYSFNSALPAFDTDGTPLSLYRMMFGLDWHHGTLGLDQTQAIANSSNGILFHDIIRPADLLSVPTPMGVPAGWQKVALGWLQGSGKDGFIAAPASGYPGGDRVQGGEEVDTWVDFLVQVDPNWRNYDQTDPPIADPNPQPGPNPTPTPDPTPVPPSQPPPSTGGQFVFHGQNVVVVADASGQAFVSNEVLFTQACWMTGGVLPYSGPYFSPGGNTNYGVGDHSFVCWGGDAAGSQGGFEFTLSVVVTPIVDPLPPTPPAPQPPPPPANGQFTLNTHNLTVSSNGQGAAWVTTFGDACTFTGGQTPYAGPYFSPGGYAWYSVGSHEITCWGNDAAGSPASKTFTLIIN